MRFILIDANPYYYSNGLAYRCLISADKIEIKEGGAKKVKKPSTTYTEEAIKKVLGITLIDGWDEKTKKVIKATNKTVSSIKKQANK